jgi:hypothetical protein
MLLECHNGAMRYRTFACLAVLGACADTSLPPTDSNPVVGGPGEVACTENPEGERVKVRFEPRALVLAEGQTRTARVVVDPDFCFQAPVTFGSTNEAAAATPAEDYIAYGRAEFDVQITGGTIGTTTITVAVPTGDPEPATAELVVDVLDDAQPSCSASDNAAGEVVAGGAVNGNADLASASVGLPDGADKPNSGSYLWSVTPFDASVGCGEDAVPPGYSALGPPVAFGPANRTFPRDIELSIPINLARMPDKARLRHLQVAYSGPAAKTPRVVTITDPVPERGSDGLWRLKFRAPRLGTYQAVVRPEAGTTTHTRRITHRAVMGVSMGGAGAMQFGLRHHHLFDSIGAMGGPVDWTWLVDHIEHNHLGGFRTIAPGTQLADIPLARASCMDGTECEDDEVCLGNEMMTEGKCTLMPAADEPYEHASTFNSWWYEYPAGDPGHGGSFDREEYLQIFRDLTLSFGNPVGYNPLALNLPTGVDPDHPAQKGDREGDECKIYVKPYAEGAEGEAQQALFDQCPVERCQHTEVLHGFYDAEYNPDGTFDVITFCDGAPQNKDWTPWANIWSDSPNNHFPMEVALAVDYNGNGKRDELEPVIASGHEPWDDWGPDQTPSELEPGYDAEENLDPSGDDYDPRYNPTGTEGNTRFDEGEAYRDFGLDGVEDTADSEYDFGEGNGTFDASPGLRRFWSYDSRGMVRGEADEMMSTKLDDDALSRLDIWTDGGTRDLFNFAVAAEHFVGSFASRGRPAAVFGSASRLPGLKPEDPDFFNPAHIVYDDVPGVVHYRYGKDDPTKQDFESGSGQHAGSVTEFVNRLQSALYFIDARWPDAPRAQMENSIDNPDPKYDGLDPTTVPGCEVNGNCTFEFTSSFGRTGQVQITLPPGYGHALQQGIRYPVIYLLHGYGMTPEDLGAAIVFLANWMNGPNESQASRLGKAILVYADGRCRAKDGEAECIRGNFFADSIREEGPQDDAWWLELMDYIDQTYRTMGESTVTWTE